MYELAFPALTNIKNTKMEGLNSSDEEMQVCWSIISPSIKIISKYHQINLFCMVISKYNNLKINILHCNNNSTDIYTIQSSSSSSVALQPGSGLGLLLRVFVMVMCVRCGVISPMINLVLVILIQPPETSVSKASRHLVAKQMKHG
jgi:hypothetical protein